MVSDINFNKVSDYLPSTDPLLTEESRPQRSNKISENSKRSFCYEWLSCCYLKRKRIVIVVGSVTGMVLLLILSAVTVLMLLPTILDRKSNSLRPLLSEETQTNYSYPLQTFSGHWKMVSQENLDALLEALGAGFFLRLIGPSVPSEITITVHGPTHLTLVKNDIITNTKEIVLNEEFEDTTADGRRVKVIYTIEGKLLVYKERWEADGEEKTSKNVAEILHDDDGIKMIGKMFVGDVVGIRTFVRME